MSWPLVFLVVGVSLNLLGQLTNNVPALLASIVINSVAIGGFMRDLLR